MTRPLRQLVAPLTSLALVAAVAIPASAPGFAESLHAQTLAAAFLPAATLPVTSSAIANESLRLGADPAELLADAATTFGSDADDLQYARRGGDLPTPPARAPRIAASDGDLSCLAKAVKHEAGGQTRDGQLAVAQLIVNRVQSGRFADSVCGVVNQQGQFFDTASYHPDTSTPGWAIALSVAQEALAGQSPSVAPGALFFHAAFQSPRAFFRTRQRVASLGGNVFYR